MPSCMNNCKIEIQCHSSKAQRKPAICLQSPESNCKRLSAGCLKRWYIDKNSCKPYKDNQILCCQYRKETVIHQKFQSNRSIPHDCSDGHLAMILVKSSAWNDNTVTSILEIITLMRIKKSLYSILAINPKEFPTAWFGFWHSHWVLQLARIHIHHLQWSQTWVSCERWRRMLKM